MPSITITYEIRQPIRIKVSGRAGYIIGFYRRDSSVDQYCVVFQNGEGDRTDFWFPVHELEPLEAGVDPPFASPWPPPGPGPGPGGSTGAETGTTDA